MAKLSDIKLNKYEGTELRDSTEQNVGNPIEYLATKGAQGFTRSIEGMVDFVSGIGPGIYGAITGNEGAKEFAKNVFTTDWFDYSAVDKQYNPSAGMQFAGEVASGIGNSLPSLITAGAAGAASSLAGLSLSEATLRGISLTALGYSATGNAIGEAINKTGEFGGKELAYGFLSGLTEVGTEAIGDALGLGTGRVMKSMAGRFATDATEAISKSTAWSIVKSLGGDFLGEGFEEGLSAILEPAWNLITGVDPNADWNWGDIGYQALVGGLSGVMMGAAQGQIDAGRSIYYGKKAMAEGKTDRILDVTRNILENGKTIGVSDKILETVKDNYDQYMSAVSRSKGKTTVRQQMLLGNLTKLNTAAMINPLLQKEALNILENADAVAEQYSAFLKDSEGNPVRLTAADISKGVNLKETNQKVRNKQIRDALMNNQKLQGIAIMSFAGKLYMQTDAWVKYAAENPGAITDNTLSQFIETASEAEKAELGRMLGIQDWNKVSAKEVNRAFELNSDAIQKAVSSAASAKEAAKGERQAAPNKFTKKTKDGAYDLGDGYVVVKRGDSYRVYNEQKDTVTRELTAKEVNTLKDQKARENEAYEENTARAKADEIARRILPDYDKLSESVKRSVRMTIRQADANDLSTEDMKLAVRLSAASGLNIVFDRDVLELKLRDKDGNLVYANGKYNMGNTVYVNPESTTTQKVGTTMLHELAHMVFNKGGNKAALASYAAAAMDDEKFDKVWKKYEDFYKAKGMTQEQYEPIIWDEISAAYAEELAMNDAFWDTLLKEDPKWKTRVPAFIRKWMARMDFKQAKTAGEVYMKVFTNAFKAISEGNQGSQAFEYEKKKNGVTEVRLSLKSYQESGRNELYKYLRNTYGKADADQTIEAFDNLYDVCKQVSKDNPELSLFSNWSETSIEFDDEGHPIFSTSVKNGEYDLNQDFSRVCKKRRHLDMVLNYLATNSNFHAENLTKEDFLAINKAIKAHGFEIACDLCFVDAKRFRQAEWAESFVDTYNSILRSVVTEGELTNFDFINGTKPTDTGVKIDTSRPVQYNKWEDGKIKKVFKFNSLDELLDAGKGSGVSANVKIIARQIKNDPRMRHLFVAKDILSSQGFDNIQRYNGELRRMLDGWGGSSVPKPSAGDVVYDNSVLLQGKYNAEAAFAMGGMRMNSFSDFMAHMFFDYCQAFADAEAKGLPIQSYTKELLFARLYGKTGGKINMSGIPAVVLGLTDGRKMNKALRTEVEKISAGLDIRRLAEHLGKHPADVTREEILNNLDLCDYVWAQESVNMDNAILLQSGIMYDRLTATQRRKALNAIREGNFEEAFKIAGEENVDREYAKHLGTIVVGVSEAHIRKLLRDNTIRMVIPYHKSGLNPQIAKAMHIDAYEDFTTTQNTSLQDKEGNKVGLESKSVLSGYTIKDFNFYDYFGKTIDGVFYDGKRTSQAYIDWCKNGRFDKILNKYVYDRTGKGVIDADELHKVYRVIPKFDQFTDEENYYKVLEDFDVYDTITGEHSPQEAVHFLKNGSALPADYKKILTEALKAEQKDVNDFEDELYENTKGLQDEIMKITEKAFDRSGERLSLPDQEYMKAVESGNMDTAQEMVDEAAKKAGYTIKAFHGTANGGNFTVFDPKKLNNSKLSSHIGQGFYFTNDKEAAKEYTKQVDIYGRTRNGENPHLFEGYIKLQNPIEVTPSSHNLRFDQVKSIVADGDNKWFFDKGIAHEIQNKEINDRTYNREELSKMSKDELIDLYVRYIVRFGDMATLQSMVDAYSYGNQDKLLDAMKRYTGHDGIHWNMREGLDQFVVFDSSQFKDSSPVTYDDQGNVIPLSERFNEQNDDIRYSIPDVEYMQAVNDGYTETAQRMVDEAAERAGFTPEHLYHGTFAFGFTVPDVSMSDDSSTFFATNKFGVAAGYVPMLPGEGDAQYHRNVRRIGVPDRNGRKPISAKMGFDKVTSAYKEAHPEFADIRKATKEDKLKRFSERADLVSDSKFLADFDFSEYNLSDSDLSQIKEMRDDIQKANQSNDLDEWAKVAQKYLPFAVKMWKTFRRYEDYRPYIAINRIEQSLRSVNHVINTELAVSNGRLLSLEYLADEYNYELGGSHVGIYDLYARQDKQLVINGNGSNWNSVRLGDIQEDYNKWIGNDQNDIESAKTRDIALYAKERGYRSVVFRDIYDAGGVSESENELSDIYAFFYPEQDVRSADPVTYEDNGDVIPLSERFNTEKNDFRYSLPDVDPIQPKTTGWKRSLTFEEVKAKYPDLWDVSADESNTKNPTSVKVTVSSYDKIFNALKEEGFKGKILDASSGLGYGAELGINKYGFDVEDVEPFPGDRHEPTYRDYAKIKGQYDVIISNAVLNVLPQDIRDSLVKRMGELLAPGGRIFVNVRGEDVLNASSKDVIDKDNLEVYISSTGSYQKGFRKPELVAYLKDALGDGYEVKATSFFGKTSAVVTKKVTQERLSIDDGVITRGMSDEDRVKILENKYLDYSAVPNKARMSSIEKYIETQGELDSIGFKNVKKLIRVIADQFGVYKNYTNNDVKLEFHYSKGKLDESVQKQGKKYSDFIKMLSCIDQVIENAIGIEVHNRNDDGYKKDRNLSNVYVLVSAFTDGERIVPVKLEVKEFFDKEKNALHVAIALESIKKDEIVAKASENGKALTPSSKDEFSSSAISVAEFLRKINPSDESFYKYIPESLRMSGDSDRLSLPDADYMALAQKDNRTKAEDQQLEQMVEQAARANGYDSPKLYHGTDSFGFTKIDVNAPGGDGFSFWATDSKATSSSYTEYGEVRGITEELTEESLEKLTAKAEEDIDDEISHFCGLINKHFSAWFFGYDGGEDYVKEKVFGANPEAGNGDGVYDELIDLVIDAYNQYGDQYNYEEFYEFQEESKEFEEIERSIVVLEGLYRRYNALANKNYDELVGGIYQLYGNTDGFYVVEGNGADWNDLPHEGLPKISRYGVEDAAYSTRDYSLWARDNGYKGILFKNIHDNGRYGLSGTGNVYAFFEPLSQVRSADPVTYDDGKVIPLSKRFNPANDDIRYDLPDDDHVTSTRGQNAKFVANNTKDKVYTRAEAEELINEILEKELTKGEELQSFKGKLKGKRKEQAIAYLFEHLNKLPEGYRAGAALKVADFIIDYAVMEEILLNPDDNTDVTVKAAEKKLEEMYSAEELKDMKQAIVRDILNAYDKKGAQSKFGKMKEKYLERIDDLREELRNATKYNVAVNYVLDMAQRLKDYVTKRKYVSSSVLANPLLDAWAKELGKLKYRSDIRKASARKILASFGAFYNANNDVLVDYYKSMNAEMDGNVLGALELIKQNMADENVSKRPLTYEEVQAASVILGAADALFRNFDTVIVDGKRQMTQDLAAAEIAVLSGIEQNDHKKMIKIHRMIEKYVKNAVDPRAVIKMLEHYDPNGVLTKLYKNLTDSETAANKQNIEFMKPFEDFLKEHKRYAKRLAETKVAIGAIGGDVELTVGQAIALYELTKREQAQRGLVESGASFKDDAGLTKSIRFYGEGKYSAEEIKKYAEKLREKVAAKLTDEDMQFIKIVEDFFNKASKDVKMKADIENYGYSNVLDEFYYPIKRSESTIATSFTSPQSIMADIAAANTFSFNKNTIQGARNEVFLNSVYDTVQQHARLMSIYANMFKALWAFDRVMNRNIGTSTDVTSVRKYLNEHVWADSEQYLKNLMADIQGVRNEKFGDKTWNALRGSFAKAQLGANLKVILAQTASLPTAMTRLSPTSILYGITHKVNFKDLDKYSDWAMVRNHEQAIVKAEGVVDKVGKVGDLLTKPIQWTDRLTIGLLWNACQAEVEKTKGLKIGTEENKQAAAKLLESVGRDTQPNYTNTERSGMMRQGNQFVKIMTMFTSAPLKQVSRFVEAVGDYSYALKSKEKKRIMVAGKKLRKTLAALLLANMMYCMIGQLFTWLYKKDRKNKAGEEISFAQDYFTDVSGTTIGMFPGLKNVFDYFNKGYDMSSFDFDVVNDLLGTTGKIVETVEKAASGQALERSDFGSLLRQTVYSGSQLVGIPTRNVMNTVTGLFKRFDPEVAYNMDTFFYNKDYRSDLAKYAGEGNEKMANMLLDMYTKENTGSMSQDAQKTLLNLYMQGYDVLPKSIGNKVSYSYTDENGDTQTESITLSSSQKKQFQSVYAKATPIVESMLDSKAFKKLSEEAQAKAIRSVYNSYYLKAKDEIAGTTTANTLSYFPKDTGKFATAIAGMNEVEATLDKKGNPISGTKKTNTYKYLTTSGLTKQEALYAMAIKGYTLKNLPVGEQTAKQMLLKYIMSLPVSQSEKASIAEKCGFTVKNNRILVK